MEVHLAYDKTGVAVHVPDGNLQHVLGMQPMPAVRDPARVVAECLAHPIGTRPLADLARGKRDAVIVICDITRAAPNTVLLPPLLRCLEGAGIPREAITILVATGLHRPCTPAEIEHLIGPETARSVRVVNHRAVADAEMQSFGTTPRGVPILINRVYAAADLKITTGFIEPHIFAGYSGGRKLICPGVAGAATIRAAHGPRLLEHPLACEGYLEGNPVHEELLSIAKCIGCDFIVNVALNEAAAITGIFAGDMEAAHAAGVAHVERQVCARLSQPADIVLTSSAGYPLDTTWYQAVKGLTAALPAVREGGTIVMAAGCAEGVGDAAFQTLTRRFPTIDAFMHAILHAGEVVDGQWQLECLARVLRRCRVALYTEGLSAEWRARLPVRTLTHLQDGVDALIREYGGPAATVAAIPHGPYILARCAS